MAYNKIHMQFMVALLATLIVLLAIGQQAEAAQGCPFEDGSCQDYCNQQGCNLGYCGHFAWIQCICRKCGDEWNSYDKIRYKPDEKVNQTELDSLNLNSTGPIILTNSTNNTNSAIKTTELNGNQDQNSAIDSSSDVKTAAILNQQQQPDSDQKSSENQQQQQPINKQQATLTTLIIPDLSEPNDKIDPNEVPDENSEKFLDFLAQNHDRLAQASRIAKEQNRPDDDDEETNNNDQQQQQQQTNGSDSSETVEIQINSGSLNANNGKPINQQTTTTTTTTTSHEKSPLETTSNAGLMKLVKLAVSQRTSDEIN